jgi:hypothetical protein
MSQELNNEQILASAIRFLIDGNEREAASILFSCSLEEIYTEQRQDRRGQSYNIELIVLRCPRYAYDKLTEILYFNEGTQYEFYEETKAKIAIDTAFKALLPTQNVVVEVCAELVSINPSWREEILKYIKGYQTHNQGTFIQENKAFHWGTFKFASPGEIEIAKALDKRKVLFLPNCKARLFNENGASISIYPDFLICHNKKWGVLEVDSSYHYNANSAASDRIRDQSLDLYGIRTWRFDYEECLQKPDEVVSRFLRFLNN